MVRRNLVKCCGAGFATAWPSSHCVKADGGDANHGFRGPGGSEVIFRLSKIAGSSSCCSQNPFMLWGPIALTPGACGFGVVKNLSEAITER